MQHEPRRTRTIVYEGEDKRIDIEMPIDNKPSTGATLRLLKRCRECGDALPPDAKFCIMCRAPTGGR